VKTTVPLIIGFLAGLVAFGELYVPYEAYRAVFEHLRDFAQILAATAFIVGGINVLQVNYPKIRRREDDWGYKVVMLASAVLMGIVGIQWHTFGDERASGSVAVVAAAGATSAIRVQAEQAEALVRIDGARVLRARHGGAPAALEQPPGDRALVVPVEPGEHLVEVMMPVAGYRSYAAKVALAPGQDAAVTADLVMLWGAQSPEGRVFTWFYDHVFYPCNATMFALLAFYIASAAFRAFRARNTESALLLGAAIFVMVGLMPVGRWLSPVFPEIEEWIMAVLNTTGRRAIMMGAALGAIATGLRVILGIERSHLGAE
jgi:hypothetical protein